MRYLTADEVHQFREDFRQKEQEIQKNIGVYLSALVVAVGWVVGPQARPIPDLFLDNHALNAGAILIIAVVNAIFATVLMQKGLLIHEYMQFVTTFTEDESAFQYWERWRRGSLSATRRWGGRAVFTIVLSGIPLLGAGLIMGSTYYYLHSEVAQRAFIESHSPSNSGSISDSRGVEATLQKKGIRRSEILGASGEHQSSALGLVDRSCVSHYSSILFRP